MFNVLYPRGQGKGELRLKLSAWLEHPDAAERPVQAKIWTYGRELVLNAKRWDGSRVTRFIDIPGGHRAFVVETWVDRTWRAPEGEGTGIVDRGMTLAWEVVDWDLRPFTPDDDPSDADLEKWAEEREHAERIRKNLNPSLTR